MSKATDVAEQLSAWQELFENEYAAMHSAARSQLGTVQQPVIIRLGDNLILKHADGEHESLINPPQFHWYKRAAHLPVAAGLALANAEASGKLAAVAGKLQQQAAELPNDERVEPIDAALTQLTGDCLQHRSLRSTALREFTAACKPWVDKLTHAAAKLELDALDSAVRAMEQRVDDEARWLRSYVVICAGHQPRYKQLSLQFFQRYFAERPGAAGESDHQVIYGESLEDVSAALDLIATRITEKWIGEVYMGNSKGMQQDVMGDAGQQLLDGGYTPSINDSGSRND